MQKGGKEVTAWAARGDLDAASVRSNTFTMEWPPRSGRQQEFPEIDRAEWFALDEARDEARGRAGRAARPPGRADEKRLTRCRDLADGPSHADLGFKLANPFYFLP